MIFLFVCAQIRNGDVAVSNYIYEHLKLYLC